MDHTVITTLRRGAILLVSMNRPEARNAFDAAMTRQMGEAMDMLDGDRDLHLGIITGTDSGFSAGADLKAFARGESTIGPRGGFGLFKSPPGKPLIAAVEGYAVGGGFELCLCCDLIVAASNAKFGLPEVRHGVAAIGGALFRLPRRMPYHLAMELALTGEFKAATFFAEHGLINKLSKPGAALAEALLLAERILANAPMALAVSKQVMSRALDWSDQEAWDLQAPLAAVVTGSADAQEGVRAFAEKRQPRWSGR